MTWFPGIRAIGFGGALIAGAALAPAVGRAATGEPADYLQQGLYAQSQADAARQRAARLGAEGGQAYKTEQVQRAERKADIYQMQANEYFAAAGVPACQPIAPAYAPSPELKAAQERLARLRESGGWAYKTGAVARAEAEVQALTPPED